MLDVCKINILINTRIVNHIFHGSWNIERTQHKTNQVQSAKAKFTTKTSHCRTANFVKTRNVARGHQITGSRQQQQRNAFCAKTSPLIVFCHLQLLNVGSKASASRRFGKKILTCANSCRWEYSAQLITIWHDLFAWRSDNKILFIVPPLGYLDLFEISCTWNEHNYSITLFFVQKTL